MGEVNSAGALRDRLEIGEILGRDRGEKGEIWGRYSAYSAAAELSSRFASSSELKSPPD